MKMVDTVTWRCKCKKISMRFKRRTVRLVSAVISGWTWRETLNNKISRIARGDASRRRDSIRQSFATGKMHKVGKEVNFSPGDCPGEQFLFRGCGEARSLHINYHRFRTYNLFTSPCTVTTPIFKTGSLSTRFFVSCPPPLRKGYDLEEDHLSLQRCATESNSRGCWSSISRTMHLIHSSMKLYSSMKRRKKTRWLKTFSRGYWVN